MQKAITILSIEEGLKKEERDKHKNYINEFCAPEKKFYDDDVTEVEGEQMKKNIEKIKVNIFSYFCFLCL